MPKYLFEASYTPEGVAGLKDAGPSSRAKAVNDMATALGGKLESFHFAFGDVDAYVVVELPDDQAAAAAAFTVGAGPRQESRQSSSSLSTRPTLPSADRSATGLREADRRPSNWGAAHNVPYCLVSDRPSAGR